MTTKNVELCAQRCLLHLFWKGVARYIDDDDDEKKETHYDPHMHFYKINFFFFTTTCDYDSRFCVGERANV